MNPLALLGGRKAIDQPIIERWKRPKDMEKKLVSELIDRDELTGSGCGISKEFETQYASYIGCQYCLAFNHGTAALMAAYYAAGVGPGDEVITPVIGYIGSYAGAVHMGARPVFCDIGAKSLLIDPEKLRKCISPRTKAINIIHLNGRICDLEEILKISKESGIPIIDDASHAHGGEWEGRKLGNFNHITCFSLQGVNPKGKPVGGGEGGVACTNTREYYQKMLAYCQLHRMDLKKELQGSPYQDWDAEVLGLKWRPHPLAMALATISLASLDRRNALLRENYRRAQDSLRSFDFLKIPECHEKALMAGFYGGIKVIYDPSLLGDVPLNLFLAALAAEGIPILKHGIGALEFKREIFAKRYDLWGRHRGPLDGPWNGLEEFTPPSEKDFPIAVSIHPKAFSLPCFIEVDDVYFTGLQEALSKLQRFHSQLLKSFQKR